MVSRALERITQLTVNYGYDWSLGDFTRAIVLRAPVAYAELGELAAEINLKWVGDDATAEAIGRRELSYRAARAYQVTWTTTTPSASSAGPGRWVSIDHPHSALSGVWPLIECAVDPLTFETDLTAEGVDGSLAGVIVLLRSQRQALTSRAIQVKRLAGAAVITIVDPETGRALAGAQVVVDNRVFITDASGEISVPGVESGQQLVITVTPPGGAPFQVTLRPSL